ncbi:membrane protein [Sphaerisporangium krabiense]|uniref:Type II secretory pathway component PulF n=1 Tax=Sphaerisporangium krabiense TaxID=763782 RepID=A0A7W8ZA42_9ACTN|nr:DUF4383 domain-containing protein [Sphaerisporangium krabiense]MBB5630284.1 type II secretory pathway component PulF [Sphaerisporangium krabiense]GII62764.1 membrane protein [Sphaerisporangium krabiense]
MGARTREMTRTPLQMAAFVIGLVFLALGILGFIPGITTDYGSMGWAGYRSTAFLFGVFQVSVLHNFIHLLFGIVGVSLARTWAGARAYLVWGGVLALLWWIYGLVIDQNSPVNAIPVNTAVNWLHFFLGIIMIALGATLSRRTPSSRRTFSV